MFANMRPIEVAVIIAVIVLLFGAKKLPELARALGESLHILRKEVSEAPSPSAQASVPSGSNTTTAATPPAALDSAASEASSANPAPMEHMG